MPFEKGYMEDQDPERLLAYMQANPEEAVRLLRQIRAKMMVPHEKQKLVLDSPARFKVLNAGRRFGKTMVGAKSIVDRARRSKDRTIWWVAPTYRIVKRGYSEVLKQLPKELLTHEPPPDTNFDAGRSVILKLKNGNRIEFYSATMPESMLGASVDYVIVDEAATMKPNIWQQIIRPTLMDRHGEAMLISTPRSLNWFYQAYQAGQDPQEDEWASWTFTSYDNPYLTEDEINGMARDIPALEFSQEVMADFVAPGSSVFQVPDESIQQATVLDNGLIEDFPPVGQCVLGIDLAKSRDWTVLYGARSFDRRNCYFERLHEVTWAEQKRRIRRAVRTMRRAGADNVTLVIDSTGLGDPIAEDLEASGYDVVPINFSGQQKPNMVKLLAKDLEIAHAFVLDDEHLNKEFRAYTMTITPAGRSTYSAPEGMHDDVVSAKMLQHWGLAAEGVPDARLVTLDGPGSPVASPSDDPDDDGEAWDDLVDGDESAMLEAIGQGPLLTAEQLVNRESAAATHEDILRNGWW